MIDTILKNAANVKASDIHITTGLEPTLRIHGKLNKLGNTPIRSEDVNSFVRHVLKNKDIETLEAKGEVDLSYSIPNLARFRVNVFRQKGNYAMVFRVIASKVPTMEELQLPTQILTHLAKKQRGLVLITGPTGSGKSTTLATMIDYINSTTGRHIITIEDPIEYLHGHKLSIVNQREIGSDTHSFASALRAALREDPDVILVGEMRDPETISIALTAAETGHLVLSTLHTVGAAKTMDRIIDSFPTAQQQQIKSQLATVIEGIVSQQLIPRVDGRGAIAALEIMTATTAIRNLIREEKTYQIQSVIQTSAKEGMKTMDSELLTYYQKGIIDAKNLARYAIDSEYLRTQVGGFI